jgi:1-acyl-sn-glycerol-3-phosphate acyltransferase
LPPFRSLFHSPFHYDIDSLDNRSEGAIEVFAEVIERTMKRYHRAEMRGAERIPAGAALYVGNHNSFAYAPEMYLSALAAYRAHGMDAVPYGLAHEVILELPFVNPLLSPLGAVRASPENGRKLLRAGKKVLVYPGGDEDAARPYRDRDHIVFGGRRGYMRLALEVGVPLVPIVAAGAHATVMVLDDLKWLAKLIGADRWARLKVWPISLSIPWGITLGPPALFIPYPSRILIEFLEPMRFERSGPEAASDDDYVAACDAQVRDAMQTCLTKLAAQRESSRRGRI